LDLGQLLRQVVDELEGAHPEARVKLECTGDAHGEWDADRLAQVFSNLVGNAVAHGEPGTVVSVLVDGRAATVVAISIRNRGSLSSDLLARLFEPLGGEAPELGQGRGLGLYISHELIRGHGGTIEVSSEAEAGTLVSVRLPRTSTRAGRAARPEVHGPDLFSAPGTD
jgi:signal transduction histidine kinase